MLANTQRLQTSVKGYILYALFRRNVRLVHKYVVGRRRHYHHKQQYGEGEKKTTSLNCYFSFSYGCTRATPNLPN